MKYTKEQKAARKAEIEKLDNAWEKFDTFMSEQGWEKHILFMRGSEWVKGEDTIIRDMRGWQMNGKHIEDDDFYNLINYDKNDCYF